MKEKKVRVLTYREEWKLDSQTNPSELLMRSTGKFTRFGYKELCVYEKKKPLFVHYSFDRDIKIESLPKGFGFEEVGFDWVKNRISEDFAVRIFSEV